MNTVNFAGRRYTLKVNTLLMFIIYFCIFWGILHDLLKLPGFFLFFNDFALVICFIFSIKNRKEYPGKKIIEFFTLSYFIIEFISYLFNFVSPFHFLFGLRNNFRYYAFFLICVKTMNGNRISKIIRMLDIFFYLNTVTMLIQRFIFGYEQDFLGGLFGYSYGCNGSLNVFFIIITSLTLIRTLNKSESMSKCIFKCGLCFGLAALSELKIYFFEFVVILIFAICATRFSWRKVFIIVGSIFGVIVGVNLLVRLFPGFAGFFSYEGVMRIVAAGSYSESGAFNRFTFIPYINSRFFNSNVMRWLGMGLGNCELSSIDLFDTDFYHSYSWMHYDWFQSVFVYLEQGLVGLIMVVLFFVLIMFLCLSFMKKNGSDDYVKVAIVCAILSIVLVFYNQSMRTEIGYLMYFMMSIPFVKRREMRSE